MHRTESDSKERAEVGHSVASLLLRGKPDAIGSPAPTYDQVVRILVALGALVARHHVGPLSWSLSQWERPTLTVTSSGGDDAGQAAVVPLRGSRKTNK